MFRTWIARLFRSAPFSPRLKRRSEPSRRSAHLHLESLEGREVPASFRWTNALGTNSADSAANWQELVSVPVIGDTWITASTVPPLGSDLIFSGSVSNANCNDLDGFGLADTTADYGSISLVGGYTGTVTFATETAPNAVNQGMAVASLTLTSGAIAQPVANTELTALINFTWTGGTLNNSAYSSTLHFIGTTATVSPGSSNTIITGSTLELGGGGATTVDFNPGTLRFNNGTGVIVESNCTMNVNAQVAGQAANVTFSGNGRPWSETDKQITLNSGATVLVTGPGSWNDDQHRILNQGGTVEIKGNATVNLTAAVPADTATFGQSGGTIQLHSGSTLAVGGKGLVLTGGSINIVADSALGETAPAKLQIDPVNGVLGMSNNNCSITFSTPATGWWRAGAQLFWTFQVTGDVRWEGGTFAPRVDAAASGISDVMQIDGKLIIAATKTLTIAPVTYNYDPIVGLPGTLVRTILIADKGIQNDGTISVPGTSPTYGFTIAQDGIKRKINLVPG